MKTTKTFENASLVSVVNGSITVKSAAGIEHTFTNASIVSVNNGTIIIETEWEPKKGEWIKAIGCGIDCYIIFASKSKDVLYTYGSININFALNRYNTLGDVIWGFNHTLQLLPVTPEEQQALNDFCKSKGKIWNKEKLQWENYRWSPKPNECYWYVASWGEVRCRHYVAINIEQDLLRLGNAFPTKEQAEIAAEKLKELFKSL